MDRFTSNEFNSKELIFSRGLGYHQDRIEVIPMDIGQAVRARIEELCREKDLSINKLSNLSGVTQSTVNNIVSGPQPQAPRSLPSKSCVTEWVSPLRNFLIRSCSADWSRKSNDAKNPNLPCGGFGFLITGTLTVVFLWSKAKQPGGGLFQKNGAAREERKSFRKLGMGKVKRESGRSKIGKFQLELADFGGPRRGSNPRTSRMRTVRSPS